MIYRVADRQDLEEIYQLYNRVIDEFEKGSNYPGWKKDVYPSRETAETGIAEENLYVVTQDDSIVATYILKKAAEPGYEQGSWNNEADYARIYVIHTFMVHPDYRGQDLGARILDYILAAAESEGMYSVRLDVYEDNQPAIRLYEKCGFRYEGMADLGYEQYGLKWFRLYEWKA